MTVLDTSKQDRHLIKALYIRSSSLSVRAYGFNLVINLENIQLKLAAEFLSKSEN